ASPPSARDRRRTLGLFEVATPLGPAQGPRSDANAQFGTGYARSANPVLELRLLAWGRSSAGRAPRSQCGGREFDPPRLHHSSPTITAPCVVSGTPGDRR